MKIPQHDDQLNQQIRRTLKRLPKTRKVLLYLRLLIRVTLFRASRRLMAWFKRPRSRAHWVGSQRRRRLERPMIILLFLCAILFLEPRQFATWAATWGGLTSVAYI